MLISADCSAKGLVGRRTNTATDEENGYELDMEMGTQRRVEYLYIPVLVSEGRKAGPYAQVAFVHLVYICDDTAVLG